jgi:predicted PurR-regulated permease PerM
MTNQSPLRLYAPWLAVAAAAIGLLYLLTPILTPFVVGAAFAYVGNPIVQYLQNWRLSRTLAVCVVFVTITLCTTLLLLLLVPLLQEQLLSLIDHIPDMLNWVQNTMLPALGIKLPRGMHLDADGVRKLIVANWGNASGIAVVVWQKVSSSGLVLFGAVANIVLIPIVSFYLMRDWPDLIIWISEVIPRKQLPVISMLAVETDEVLGAFLRGQLLVMASLAFIYGFGLELIGVQPGLIIGLIAGVLSFVPYLGFISGFGAAIIASLVQSPELTPLLWVCLVFGVGQIMESSVLTPKLVGDRIGLHPVAVIFAVMAGGELFGFSGVLLALPATAVIAVLMRHTKSQWMKSPLYLGE